MEKDQWTYNKLVEPSLMDILSRTQIMMGPVQAHPKFDFSSLDFDEVDEKQQRRDHMVDSMRYALEAKAINDLAYAKVTLS